MHVSQSGDKLYIRVLFKTESEGVRGAVVGQGESAGDSGAHAAVSKQ